MATLKLDFNYSEDGTGSRRTLVVLKEMQIVTCQNKLIVKEKTQKLVRTERSGSLQAAVNGLAGRKSRMQSLICRDEPGFCEDIWS